MRRQGARSADLGDGGGNAAESLATAVVEANDDNCGRRAVLAVKSGRGHTLDGKNILYTDLVRQYDGHFIYFLS
jgi:hypothetical protein